jgi:hypothetical protein
MKITLKKNKFIGAFQVLSGALVVSDPCYESGAAYTAIFPKAKTGVWIGTIGMAKLPGGAIAITDLTASVVTAPKKLKWIDSGILVGVDSGQVGIFDRSKYGDRSAEGLDCTAAVCPFGIVSVSGFGDGVNPCLIKQHEGKIVAVKVLFVDLNNLEGGAS